MNSTLELFPRRARGYTLMELMMTLTIAGIMLGLAVPGFTSFIRSNRAEVQSAAIVTSLRYARSEAIRRATPVRVMQATGGWTNGWTVFVDTNNNASKDNGETELRNTPALSGDATWTGSATSIVFDRTGAATNVTASDPATFDYRLGADYCSLERDITINHLGRIMVTRRTC